MPPTCPPRMSSRQLWRKAVTSRRLRQWCADIKAHAPRRCCSTANDHTEEDPGHYAQRRCKDGPSHAHNTIRHAQQVEAAQEAHVLLLRGVPEARCSGQAAAGVDPGLVCRYYGTTARTRADYVRATLFDSICRHQTNTYEETHCASCRTFDAQHVDDANTVTAQSYEMQSL